MDVTVWHIAVAIDSASIEGKPFQAGSRYHGNHGEYPKMELVLLPQCVRFLMRDAAARHTQFPEVSKTLDFCRVFFGFMIFLYFSWDLLEPIQFYVVKDSVLSSRDAALSPTAQDDHVGASFQYSLCFQVFASVDFF